MKGKSVKKESYDKQIIVRLQAKLFEDFEKTCEENYKSKSEVLRDFMIKYIQKYKKNNSA